MPIYEYQCEECGHVTESLRRMSEADESQACESCGSKKTQRQHSVFAAGSGESNMPAGECPLPMGGGCGCCGNPQGSCGLPGM